MKNKKTILREVLEGEKWKRECPSENNKTLIRLIKKAIDLTSKRIKEVVDKEINKY